MQKSRASDVIRKYAGKRVGKVGEAKRALLGGMMSGVSDRYRNRGQSRQDPNFGSLGLDLDSERSYSPDLEPKPIDPFAGMSEARKADEMRRIMKGQRKKDRWARSDFMTDTFWPEYLREED